MVKSFNLQRFSFFIGVSLLLALLTIQSRPTIVGAQNQPPLLPNEVIGVNATSDTVLDITLPSGFILSGNIKSADQTPIFFGTVTAQSGDQAFTGPIVFGGLSSTYRIVLPAGTYQLSVDRAALDEESGAFFQITTVLQDMVTVSGNRTLDLTVPAAPPAFPVSGMATSLGNLPTEGVIRFTSSDELIEAFGDVNGEYSLGVPAGTYYVVVSLALNDMNESLSIPVGSITVDGPETYDFVLPTTVPLSGTVTHNDATPAVPAGVFASSADDSMSTSTASAFVSIPEESATGAYELVAPPGSYHIGAFINLDLGQDTSAGLSFPFPFPALDLTNDQTHDFIAPLLPPMVTISGRVTDELGQPVANALVSASTTMLTNTPNAIFFASAQTDSDGYYELVVLSGSDYSVDVEPPEEISPGPFFWLGMTHAADMASSRISHQVMRGGYNYGIPNARPNRSARVRGWPWGLGYRRPGHAW